MSTLLFRPHRHPDECIVSYLIRVSEGNGFRHIGYLLQHAGLPWKNVRVPTYQMLTGQYDIAPYFLELGLPYLLPKTAEAFSNAQEQGVTAKIFVKRPKVCPNCLKNKGYSSYQWSFLICTTCPEHKQMLVDTEDNGKPLSWYRSSIDAVKSETTGQSGPEPLPASAPAIALTNTMMRLIEGKPLPKSAPTVLLGLSFAEALSVLHFIAHYQYRLFQGGNFSPASLDNLALSHHYTKAWNSLDQWPSGFNQLLSQYIDTPMSKRGQSGINKHFRDIHESLYRQRKNKGIARVRAAFDQYVTMNWPNWVPNKRLSRINSSDQERPLISQMEAQRILGCREPRIHSLLAQRKLHLHRFKGRAYFNREEVERLNELYKRNWSIREAMLETELSRHQLHQLLEAGLIRSLQKPSKYNRDWLISKEDWKNTMARLIKSATSVLEDGYSLNGLQKLGFDITEVFNRMLSGEISFSHRPIHNKPLSFRQMSNFHLVQA